MSGGSSAGVLSEELVELRQRRVGDLLLLRDALRYLEVEREVLCSVEEERHGGCFL